MKKIFKCSTFILIFIIIFRTVFSKIIIKICYKLMKQNKSAKESVMYKPLNTFFILLGIFFMINILPTNEQLLFVMNKIFKIIVIYYIVKVIATLITEDSFIIKKFLKNSNNKIINRIMCLILRIILWIIFIFIALNELGYTEILKGLGGLATGLGIGSAALALAAQDIVKSMLSGVAILTDKPFVIGDWIEVGEFQGTVIDITFRSTRIKSYNNAVVTIPNSTITSTYVVNWNRLTSRRFDCILNLSLETTSDKIKKIINEIKLLLQNNPKVIKETVEVTLDQIASCSSNIKIFLYVRESEYSKF